MKTIQASIAGGLLCLMSSVAIAEESPNLTERVAKAVVAFDYKQLPPEVVTQAETLIRDSLACAVGAHSSEALLKWEEIIDPNGGDCTILHSGKKGKLLEAIALNSQAANMLDFDDAHTGIGHPGATIVPVALSIAEKYGKSREEVIEAVAAGYEFNIRWGRAVFDFPGKMAGPWSLTLLQAYGSYITAAKLLDLDETQIARGLYFAAAGMPLPTAQKIGANPGQTMNGMKNYYGQCSQSMTQAALLAKAGIYSDTEVLDGDQGLWRMMSSKEFHEERVLADLGKEWLIHEMQLKPYSACRWNHAAIDAMYELAPQFKLADLKQIDIHTFKSAVDACSKPNPSNTFELAFSLPHCFGMVLHDHSLILLAEDSVTDEEVLATSQLVKVHLDDEMQGLFAKGKLPARVVITLKDGKALEKEVLTMKGEPDLPMSAEEHAAKLKALLDSNPNKDVRALAEKWSATYSPKN